MYSLNYDMIARVLWQFHYTGEVHADLPSRAEIKGGGRAILIVQAGSIVSCSIFTKSREKLYHNVEAYQRIVRLGVLDWVLVPSFASVPPRHAATEPLVRTRQPVETPLPVHVPVETPAHPHPAVETPVPDHLPVETPAAAHDIYFPRHRPVSPTQMRAWSMLYRSVYSLCDGTHSNELIATLLSRSPHNVEKVIRDLIDADAVEK